MLDVMVGLALVAALAAALVTVGARQRRVSLGLADVRAAARAAEAALADLQSGRPPAAALGDGGAVKLARLPGPSGVPGRTWVEATATVAGRSAVVAGLVPDGPHVQAMPVVAPPGEAATRPAGAAANGPTTREVK